jgi:hypothetical protein
MAVWQYDLALVPRTGIIRLHGEIPKELPGHRAVWQPETGLNEVFPNYWEGLKPPESLRSEISRLLPPLESWSDRALMFGEKRGNLIKLWLGEALYLSFDLRRLDLDLLRAVIELAKEQDLLWVSDTLGQPIVADLERVLQDMQSSDAHRFCKDREAYLKAPPPEARVKPDSEQVAPPNGGPAGHVNSGRVNEGCHR